MLANSLKELSQARKSEDWNKCIQICKIALRSFTKKNMEDQYAIKINLALCLLNTKSKNNIEEAIAIYKGLLRKAYILNDLKRRGALYRNLGYSYQDRINGDKKKNLQLAIKAFQKSLNFFSYKNYPDDWGLIKGMIGLSFAKLSQGIHKEMLKKALKNYKEALPTISSETDMERREEVIDGIKELETSLKNLKTQRKRI